MLAKTTVAIDRIDKIGPSVHRGAVPDRKEHVRSDSLQAWFGMSALRARAEYSHEQWDRCVQAVNGGDF